MAAKKKTSRIINGRITKKPTKTKKKSSRIIDGRVTKTTTKKRKTLVGATGSGLLGKATRAKKARKKRLESI